MRVLIKGMEMPKNCAECEFHQSGYPDWCDLSIRARDIHNMEIRQEWCPLVEVPTPHGRLIDKDALLGHMKKTHDKWKIKGHYTPTTDDEIMTMNMPTIIEAEEGEEDE